MLQIKSNMLTCKLYQLSSELQLLLLFQIGAMYRSNAMVMVWLAVDAAYLGFLSAVWAMAILPDK